MKMLFRSGSIGKNAQGVGIDKIHFTTFNTDILRAFEKIIVANHRNNK